jgi:hypothetical protein
MQEARRTTAARFEEAPSVRTRNNRCEPDKSSARYQEGGQIPLRVEAIFVFGDEVHEVGQRCLTTSQLTVDPFA